MKILEIDIPKERMKLPGLKPIKMKRLGNTVIIAGKNGSGKSRILDFLFRRMNIPEQFQRIEHDSHLDKLNIKIDEIRNKIKIENLDENLKLNYESSLSRTIAERDLEIKNQDWKYLKLENDSHFQAVFFVPNNLVLEDPKSFSPKDLDSNSVRTQILGLENISKGALSKIKVIQQRYWMATHPQFLIDQNTDNRKREIDKAKEDYSRLKKVIKEFLDTDLDTNLDGDIILFNNKIQNQTLSPGQIVLLQLCIALYSQASNLSDVILVMDEPENHLHPSILIEVIQKISDVLSKGQLWIATHSVHILSHFDPNDIWYVNDGEIKHAGKIPEQVLLSLLGNVSRIGKLQDFLDLPAQYASTRFAIESIYEPRVVETNHTDPQSLQIRSELKDLSKEGKLKILDFGAGKGRIISNLSEQDNLSNETLIEYIDYVAYDKYSTNSSICKDAISALYGDSTNRYYTEYNKMFTYHNENTFDVIIMCNVLHEIDPNTWLDLFQKELPRILKDDGVLLLVEDHKLPIGELAYQKGFLILDTPQLKNLFDIRDGESLSVKDHKGDFRLKSHIIGKKFLERVTEYTRTKAVTSLSELAKENIIEVRVKDKNYTNGKEHGLWVQQYANAMLNLANWTVERK